MNKRGTKRFIKPQEMGQIDREQFAYAFELANQAGSMAMPVENPEQYGVTLVDEESGEDTRIRFTDQPINRAILALKKHCGSDSVLYFNVTMRFFAMLTILKRQEVESWMTDDSSKPGCAQLHTAVVYAGAEATLDKDGEFDIDEFFERVENIASELDE